MDKRVLLVNDFYEEGGAEKVCEQMGGLLEECGYEIEYFLGAKKYQKPDNALEYIFSKKYYSLFKSKIEEFNPDIIHLHNFYHLLSPGILKAIKDCRRDKIFSGTVFMTAHDYHLLCPNSGYFYYENGNIASHESPPSFWQMLFKNYDKRGSSYSLLKKIQWVFNYYFLGLQDEIDVILSPSNFLKRKFKENFEDKPIHLVRNPYEFNVEQVSNNDEQSYSLTLKLVFLGRISPEKGIQEFIISLEKSSFNNYTFDVIGDGSHMKEIQQTIAGLGLSEKVRLLGRIPYEEVIRKISAYDALVLPSLWVENAPLVLIEAVIAKIRILTSKWGGMKELADLSGESYLMNPLEHKSVENSLTQLQNVVQKNKSVDRNIAGLKKKFSKELFIKKIDKFYLEYCD